MTGEIGFDARWRRIQRIWKNDPWLYAVAGFLLGLMVFPALELLQNNLKELLSGLVPETMGIVVTVLVIERLNENRAKREREIERRERLIREAGSPVKDVAVHAIDEIRKLGLLTGADGILKGANLLFANLKEVNLNGAHLERAFLIEANLQAVILGRANLKRATLWGANLEEAKLTEANLQAADLANANLQAADLGGANLQAAKLYNANLERANPNGTNLEGADLRIARLKAAILANANLQAADLGGANLQAADLQSAKLDGANLQLAKLEGAVLPDAKQVGEDGSGQPIFDLTYTPDTDMRRYTDPTHPDFWQP